ncbi:MAG: flagellar biosynthetic protein FliR, partial [Nitrospirae bacterium]|nr:flagellar biosynthetic protein FliR [Nitrospirota bacterium]
MDQLINAIVNNQTSFLFIMTRVSSFLAALPMMDGRSLPNSVKILLVLSITLVLFPVVHINPPPPGLFDWMTAFLRESLIGLLMGFGTRVIFAAVELGGEISGLQMGLNVANLYDPAFSRQVSLIGKFEVFIAVMIFFGINAHHIVLQALVSSFSIPYKPEMNVSSSLAQYLIRMTGEMFMLGMKIGIPVLMTLLMTAVAMGILSRVVPQIQIFFLSFPLTIGLGLLILGASTSMIISLVSREFHNLGGVLNELLQRV